MPQLTFVRWTTADDDDDDLVAAVPLWAKSRRVRVKYVGGICQKMRGEERRGHERCWRSGPATFPVVERNPPKSTPHGPSFTTLSRSEWFRQIIEISSLPIPRAVFLMYVLVPWHIIGFSLSFRLLVLFTNVYLHWRITSYQKYEKRNHMCYLNNQVNKYFLSEFHTFA